MKNPFLYQRKQIFVYVALNLVYSTLVNMNFILFIETLCHEIDICFQLEEERNLFAGQILEWKNRLAIARTFEEKFKVSYDFLNSLTNSTNLFAFLLFNQRNQCWYIKYFVSSSEFKS